jgi:hypothetical protein
MDQYIASICESETEVIKGGAGSNVPPGLVGPLDSSDPLNQGQLRAYEAGGIAGFAAAWVGDEPVYYARFLKNGKSVSWGS